MRFASGGPEKRSIAFLVEYIAPFGLILILKHGKRNSQIPPYEELHRWLAAGDVAGRADPGRADLRDDLGLAAQCRGRHEWLVKQISTEPVPGSGRVAE